MVATRQRVGKARPYDVGGSRRTRPTSSALYGCSKGGGGEGAGWPAGGDEGSRAEEAKAVAVADAVKAKSEAATAKAQAKAEAASPKRRPASAAPRVQTTPPANASSTQNGNFTAPARPAFAPAPADAPTLSAAASVPALHMPSAPSAACAPSDSAVEEEEEEEAKLEELRTTLRDKKLQERLLQDRVIELRQSVAEAASNLSDAHECTEASAIEHHQIIAELQAFATRASQLDQNFDVVRMKLATSNLISAKTMEKTLSHLQRNLDELQPALLPETYEALLGYLLRLRRRGVMSRRSLLKRCSYRSWWI